MRDVSCAYCGASRPDTSDHVIPKALYPPSKASSRFQRITVPACTSCNQSWGDDEPHFRNVLLISGEASPAVRELWTGKTARGFEQSDGRRRFRDVAAQLVAVQMPEGERHKVYPGRDPRVMRIIRKVIRGLCHHHGLLSPVPDALVWADVHRFQIPPAFLDEMREAHAEEDVLRYRFGVLDDEDIHSSWLLTFYERTPFIGIVFRSEAGRARIEAVAPDREAS